MWKYFGTLVNVAAVLLGGLIGLRLKRRSRRDADAAKGRESLPDVMMPCLGLCTLFASASGLIGVESGAQAIVVVASMVLGLLIGYALDLDGRINRMGDALVRRAGGGAGAANPAAGFVTASLLFCIGSMAILGSFEGARNGPGGLDLNCHTTLLIKSLLDFVSATCLSISYGASVMASAGCVLIFQGALTLLASFVQPFLMEVNALPVVNCVGSLILVTISMNLIGLKKFRTADYLPAIFLPVLICYLLHAAGAPI